GPGVDYCLFLTARYREELDQGASPCEAAKKAVSGVGDALTASAATVICGIGMMYFARFGQFRQAGLAIPFSLVIVLLATLTFSPSFLCLVGRWAFWPQRERTERRGAPPHLGGWLSLMGDLQRLWNKIAQLVLEKPGTAWVATVIALVPFAAIAVVLYNHVSYVLVGELPANSPSVSATRMLPEHFPAGMVGPTTALLVVPDLDFGSPQGRTIAGRITDEIRSRKDQLDVADIRSLTAPLGTRSTAKEAFANTDLP